MQRRKATGSQYRVRVPFCSRSGKVIIAAKGKGSYRREKIDPRKMPEVSEDREEIEGQPSPAIPLCPSV